MQRHFDADLAELRHFLVTMGALVESMLGQAVRLLTEHDDAVAQQLYQDEAEVNRLHLQIDDICLRLLALRQPAAADLRLIASALKMNSDLERIGDQAINLLKRAQTLDRQEGEWPTIDLSPLVRIASSMVADALDAFIRKDVALARKVLEDEKTADQLRHEIESVLIVQAEKKTHNFLQLLQLILVTHHLERIADHATNIAEDVIYFLEGRDVRHHHA
ncbi:MAG TPA: phosphate signaling complex protein PhoU [bacterium]|nr:phosphate signaling complex protein PhoU [bacterium]